MAYLAQMKRAIDFIEDRLDAELSIAAVAAEVGLSRWHFQRIFKALTNETIHTYIRSRRLATALDLLARTDTKILEIAMSTGFQSQAAFTRAFKQAFGITPAAYRRIGDRGRFVHKMRFDAEYLVHLRHGVSPEPELVERPAMRVVGLRTEIYGPDSDKNNIAERLPPLWAAFVARMSEVPDAVPGCCYGVIEPVSEESEHLSYVAGIEVRGEPTLPADMVTVDVPGGTWATFAHHGRTATLDHTVNYVYSSWLLRSDRRHSLGPDLEIYGPQYVEDSDASVIHYAIPLRP